MRITGRSQYEEQVARQSINKVQFEESEQTQLRKSLVQQLIKESSPAEKIEVLGNTGVYNTYKEYEYTVEDQQGNTLKCDNSALQFFKDDGWKVIHAERIAI